MAARLGRMEGVMDAKTYWACQECGETTNGERSLPCRCMRDAERRKETPPKPKYDSWGRA